MRILTCSVVVLMFIIDRPKDMTLVNRQFESFKQTHPLSVAFGYLAEEYKVCSEKQDSIIICSLNYYFWGTIVTVAHHLVKLYLLNQKLLCYIPGVIGVYAYILSTFWPVTLTLTVLWFLLNNIL